MAAEGWAIVIGAFFSGLTGLLLATLPLILQLRKNEEQERKNAVVTAANTVALVNGSVAGPAVAAALDVLAPGLGELGSDRPDDERDGRVGD